MNINNECEAFAVYVYPQNTHIFLGPTCDFFTSAFFLTPNLYICSYIYLLFVLRSSYVDLFFKNGFDIYYLCGVLVTITFALTFYFGLYYDFSLSVSKFDY